MRQATPYLNFLGQTEEAFAFYRDVFGGEYVGSVVRYRDMGMSADEPEGDLVAHVLLRTAGGAELMASDVGGPHADSFRVGNNVQIHMASTDRDEARRAFDALALGGTVLMPLERTSWSELFGSCIDRYGVYWMIDYAGESPAS
jgi:PhnB protein